MRQAVGAGHLLRRVALGYRRGVKSYQLILALPFMLAFGLAAHAVLARGVKAVLWAWSPLASGEPEAARYERRVYHTADMAMAQVMLAAAGAGLPWWLALATGSGLLAWGGLLALAAVMAFDVLRWERVAVSAHSLWFQRGYRGKVHQVAMENIRDLSVEETEVRGFTLRHGRRNRLVRLQVRMNDKRVIALPKTDAHNSLDEVEAVANHLRMRLQQLQDSDRARQAAHRPGPIAGAHSQAAAEQEEDLKRALARLRAGAAPKGLAR